MSCVATIVSPVAGKKIPAWVPTDISGCVLWLRADMGLTLDGSNVAAWADQSGNDNDAVQATPARQPAYSAIGGPNGLPAVDFVRANGRHLAWPIGSFTDASTNYTVLAAIVQRNAATTQQHVFGWTAAPLWQYCSPVISGVANVGGYDGVAWRNSAAAAVNGAQVLTWILADAANLMTCYRNGVSIGSAAWSSSALGDNGVNPVIMGALVVGGQNLDAAVSELIVYNSVLGATPLSALRLYSFARYGL
jgi:hypothetical protein